MSLQLQVNRNLYVCVAQWNVDKISVPILAALNVNRLYKVKLLMLPFVHVIIIIIIINIIFNIVIINIIFIITVIFYLFYCYFFNFYSFIFN